MVPKMSRSPSFERMNYLLKGLVLGDNLWGVKKAENTCALGRKKYSTNTRGRGMTRTL